MKLPSLLSSLLIAITTIGSVGCTHPGGITHGRGLHENALLPSASARPASGGSLIDSLYLGAVCVNHRGVNTVLDPSKMLGYGFKETRLLEAMCEDVLTKSLLTAHLVNGPDKQGSARALIIYMDIKPTKDTTFTITTTTSAVNANYSFFLANPDGLKAVQAAMREKRPGAPPAFVSSPSAAGLRQLHQVALDSQAEVRVSEERAGAIRAEKTYLKAIRTNLESLLTNWTPTAEAINSAAQK